MEYDRNITELQSIFNRINRVKYNKVNDLEINHKYYGNRLDCVKTTYEDHIIVTVDDDLKIFLPASWADRISDHDISHLNTRHTWFYIVYRRLIYLPNCKSKHDIEFTMNS